MRVGVLVFLVLVTCTCCVRKTVNFGDGGSRLPLNWVGGACHSGWTEAQCSYEEADILTSEKWNAPVECLFEGEGTAPKDGVVVFSTTEEVSMSGRPRTKVGLPITIVLSDVRMDGGSTERVCVSGETVTWEVPVGVAAAIVIPIIIHKSASFLVRLLYKDKDRIEFPYMRRGWNRLFPSRRKVYVVLLYTLMLLIYYGWDWRHALDDHAPFAFRKNVRVEF